MILRYVNDIKKYLRYTLYSAQASLKAEVVNSYLDWIWWLLEPFCLMLIYTIVFDYIFKMHELYFPVFAYIGITLWTFFSKVINESVLIVRRNAPIVKKIYIPKHILILSNMFLNMFKMFLSFIIIFLMMILFQIPVSINILYCIPIFIVLFMVTYAFATLLLNLGVYIQDFSYIVSILLKFLTYFTGTFYNIESRIDPPWSDWLLCLNPMAMLIASMRKALIYCQTPDLKLLLLWTVLAIIIASIGIRTIYKNENGYVKII